LLGLGFLCGLAVSLFALFFYAVEECTMHDDDEEEKQPSVAYVVLLLIHCDCGV